MTTQSPPVPAVSCSICRDNLDDTSEAVAIACGHVFHERCVGEWLKQSLTCPQCRKRLRNPQKDTMRVYLSFGCLGDDAQSEGGAEGGGVCEPAGLAELRQRLAAATEESQETRKRLRRCEKRDAQLRRDLSQRQRQIDVYSTQLETFQESLTQQASENSQLMQLLAQEYQDQSELRKLRAQLDEERLARGELCDRVRELEGQCSSQLQEMARLAASASRSSEAGRRCVEELQRLRAESADLRSRLEATQQEAAALSERLETERSANSDLTDEVLAREAENFDLSKRLNAGHGLNSVLTNRLRSSELRVAQLNEQLLRLRTPGSSGVAVAAVPDPFSSLPIALSSDQAESMRMTEHATLC